MKINSFKDIWKPPFKNDHYGYVWSKDNVMTFTIDDLTEDNEDFVNEFADNIVNVLNGKEVTRKYEDIETKDGCDIYINNELVGYFRGWGHMIGGLNLSPEEASKYQDELIQFVLTKLKN